jgi:chorismate dehydratase
MQPPRISASSYSNTAPLIWSFLYGSNHGKVELILDNAPARSSELLAQDRVDVALVPVIASQLIDGVKLIPDVCIGAKRNVQSVCLVTNGEDLEKVRTVSLDVSSRTSVVLTKIIFREFLGFDPEWRDAEPDIKNMLSTSDAALLIGDPALAVSTSHDPLFRTYDLAELWHSYTSLGFVFAMWMTRRDICEIDLAASRDEGLSHLREIAANYAPELQITTDEMHRYLAETISYSIDESMRAGLDLFFRLASQNQLIGNANTLQFLSANP